MRKGFTMAEVLITLAIIGVVAALTIPNVIKNYQKQALVSALKVDYKELNDGFRMMMANDGVSDFGDTELMRNVASKGSDTDNAAAEAEAIKVMSKYFRKIKVPKRMELHNQFDQYNSDCSKLVGQGMRWSYLNDKTKCWGYYNMLFEFPNGMYLNIMFFADNYTLPKYYKDLIKAEGSRFETEYAQVFIDVNGPKGPNTWGRDAFYFFLTQLGELVPAYGKDYEGYVRALDGPTDYNWKTLNYCNPSLKSSVGYGCAARIIESGWKMDY